jgi:hypothetical protein
MWVPRTSEEVANWKTATEREARFQGLLFAGLAYGGIAVLLAGGWVAGVKWVAIQDGVTGGFWPRLLVFLLLGLPVAVWVFRREKRVQLDRASRMTICPKCDTAGEGNAGERCRCGGEFALQSAMRWDDEETDSAARSS